MRAVHGWQVRETVAALLILTAGLLIIAHCAGCSLFQHEEAARAAEMLCVEKYRTTPQIEACREVVNGITSKYTKDAGAPGDAAGE